MQEQMRKLVEESHTKKGKKKKKDYGDGSRSGSVQPKKKKAPGEIKPPVTDTVAASISSVVSLIAFPFSY